VPRERYGLRLEVMPIRNKMNDHWNGAAVTGVAVRPFPRSTKLSVLTRLSAIGLSGTCFQPGSRDAVGCRT
jgi:hypothetical protein